MSGEDQLAMARIRPMEAEDLSLVLSWRNHDSVRKMMLSPQLISPEQHQQWFATMSRDKLRQLLIFERDHRPAGFVQFTLPQAGGVSEWGFYVDPKSQSGTGQQMGKAALAYAFERLGLHKIYGQVLLYNERSIRFHQRLGFGHEGVLREHHYDGAHYHDIWCFGLLKTDWHINTIRE